ncbi:MAG: hypothetical protein KF683_01250 [Rubrivivax sp.]|nr:hypothetical protein [Rubrivivax sp.]
MARDERIEARLQRWAQYVVVGDGSGYPAMSIVHPDWTPPSPGVTPAMKVHPRTDVHETHRAIGTLSVRLRNTVVVHYCLRLPVAEQAARLECAEQTVFARVDEAHRQLRAALGSFSDLEFSG